MKQFVVPLVIIFMIAGIRPCFGQCQKCDTLFEQIKSDLLFISFLASNDSVANLYAENAKKFPRPGYLRDHDSKFMRDSSIPVQDKFDSMRYEVLHAIKELNSRSLEKIAKLEEKYPLLKQLSEEEFEMFSRMSAEYYYIRKKRPFVLGTELH